MSSVKISLAKALKVKNRLAGRLDKAKKLVISYNSMPEGRVGEVNVKKAVEDYHNLSSALVELKTSIARGSMPIQKEILQLAEFKGEIEFLQSLPTKNGDEAIPYRNEVVKYVAVVSKDEVIAKVKNLEKWIDDLQDKIDNFNYSPERIEIDSKIIELAS